jgi:TetR/AcrR family acrAB operon transcriptional repressor
MYNNFAWRGTCLSKWRLSGLARKTKELALETREKLLESALDVMSEKPFDTVSIEEIANRVGLSKGAVYWHFKNKSDLLVNLIRGICENVAADSPSEGNAPENFEGLRRFFADKLRETNRDERLRKISKLMHRRCEWPDDTRSTILALVSERTKYETEIIAGVILRCQERGEIRADFPAGEIAVLLSAIFHGMFFLQLSEIFSMDLAKYANFIFDALEKELKSGGNINLCKNA